MKEYTIEMFNEGLRIADATCGFVDITITSPRVPSGKYKVYYMVGQGDGEIFASVEWPTGGFVPGLSGWYRSGCLFAVCELIYRKILVI